MNIVKKYLNQLFLNQPLFIPENESLSGKVIIVTGAGRGIGLATADLLYKSGATVVAVSRDTHLLKNRFAKADPARFLIVSTDIKAEHSVKKLIKDVLTQFKKVDVLVNNAGINIEKPLELTTTEEFENIFETNMKGTYLTSREVIPAMKKSKSGTIINIGSKISHNTQVGANKALYTATKYAIEGFSFALNRELKPHGIRVSCLMPGTVNTFISKKGSQFLSPYQVASVIDFMIKHDKIDFESILMKSQKQNI